MKRTSKRLTRDELGEQLRRIVRYAHARRPPRLLAPVAWADVRCVEADLRRLASRLQAPSPVQPRGVAQAELLITDGRGPLYHSGHSRELGAAVRAAVAALD